MKTPITVTELMDKLREFSPTDVVMIELDYVGRPLTPEAIGKGKAAIIGPYEAQLPADMPYSGKFESVNGRLVQNRTVQVPSAWRLLDENDDRGGAPIEPCDCVVISLE